MLKEEEGVFAKIIQIALTRSTFSTFVPSSFQELHK
jgi:hypothetical protein